MTRTTRTILSSFSILFLGLFALFPALTAKAQVVNGTISGTVTDPSGAVISNATVVVHNDDIGVQRSLTTNSTGTFTAPAIPIGSYTISVDASGFGSYKRTGITLTVGQTLNLTLSLKIVGSETVTVQDVPAAVNLSSDQISGLVDARQVNELPLNGRSYDQLLLLNPATVNYTNQRSGSTGTSNSSVGSMFSASGRRPQDNLFLLNGIEYTGASTSTPPPAEPPVNSSESMVFTSSTSLPTPTRPPTASATGPRYPSPPPAAPTRFMAAFTSSSATAS